MGLLVATRMMVLMLLVGHWEWTDSEKTERIEVVERVWDTMEVEVLLLPSLTRGGLVPRCQ